ncbi:uncharacterized protein LOC105645546 [Jatropha curcas]|nr:uncharacterized protein LOC105645546 [Jatropha curcas]XP_037491150.1 uncharacterized protein LOC105645546 [Jatropha curcas]
MPNPQIEQATPSTSSMNKYMGSGVRVSSKRKDKEVTNEPEKVDSLPPKKSLSVVQSESVQSIGTLDILVDPFPASILPENSAPLFLRTENTTVQATDSSVSQSNSSLAADLSKIEDDEAFFQQILLSLSQPEPGIPTAPCSSVLANSSEVPVGTQVLNALDIIRQISERGDDVFTIPQLFGRFVDNLETVVRYDGGGQMDVHRLTIVKRIARDIQSLKTDFDAPSAFGISLDRKEMQKKDLHVQCKSTIQAGLAKTMERKAVSDKVIELEARLAEMKVKEMALKAEVNSLKDEVKAQQENLRSLASSISADEKEQERLLKKKEFARQALLDFSSSIFPSDEAPR